MPGTAMTPVQEYAGQRPVIDTQTVPSSQRAEMQGRRFIPQLWLKHERKPWPIENEHPLQKIKKRSRPQRSRRTYTTLGVRIDTCPALLRCQVLHYEQPTLLDLVSWDLFSFHRILCQINHRALRKCRTLPRCTFRTLHSFLNRSIGIVSDSP